MATFLPQPGSGIALLLVGLFITFLDMPLATITHLASSVDLGSTYDENDHACKARCLLMSIAGLLTTMTSAAIVEGGTADPAEARVEALGAYALVLVAPAIAISSAFKPSGSGSATAEFGFGDALRRLFRRPELRRLLLADFVQGIAGGMLLERLCFHNGSLSSAWFEGWPAPPRFHGVGHPWSLPL